MTDTSTNDTTNDTGSINTITTDTATLGAERDSLWQRAAVVLRQQVSEAVWFSTFSDISVEHEPATKIGGTMSLTLRVPNAFVRDRVLTRYMSLVRDALDEAGGASHELRVDIRPVAARPTPVARRRPRLLRSPHHSRHHLLHRRTAPHPHRLAPVEAPRSDSIRATRSTRS